MRIALASDLHLEFQDINLKNTENADVLILSGDIAIAQDLHDHAEPLTPYPPEVIKTLGSRQRNAQLYRDFFKRCSEEFSHVVYVAGNHEFYNGRWVGSLNHLREECSKFTNIYFLECDTKIIDNVTFIGATLWTDMNKSDPITLHSIAEMMNDFRIIRNDEHEYAKLRPIDTVYRHKKTLKYLKNILTDMKDHTVVFVGHHGPTKQSTHPRYQNEQLMNGAYTSDVSEIILDNPQIKLWTHGHTHDPFDYMVGGTRVVCNPRGYGGYDYQAEIFQLKYLDI